MTTLETLLSRVLVVEDDAPLRDHLVSFFRSLGAPTCVSCSSVGEGNGLLTAVQPTLLVLDYELPDGAATELLRRAVALESWPDCLLISGAATPGTAFEAARLGARIFLEKPVSPATLRGALVELTRRDGALETDLRGVVGHVSIHDMQQHVRDVMLTEALGRARGNRRGAARLLRVSRQLVQHMVRARTEREDAGAMAFSRESGQ